MSVVDDLVTSLIERNAIKLNGAVNITLVEGGVKIIGRAVSTLRDQRKGKDILNVNIPVDADVRIGEVVIPLPRIP